MLEFVFSSCFQNLILHENKSSFPFKQEYVAEQKIFKAEEKQKEDKDDDWIKAYIKGKEMMADLTREKDADTNRWVQGCFSLLRFKLAILFCDKHYSQLLCHQNQNFYASKFSVIKT